MRTKYCREIAAVLIALLAFHNFSDSLRAQDALPTAQQLDQLLAPIALYPDALVAQITAAAADPQEILDVDAWLRQNSNLRDTALTDAAQAQGFDPPFLALLSFPQVLDMMAQNIDDYAAIGQVFSANQGAVMDSIQRLRAQAYASGALRSTSQLQVVQQPQGSQQIIVIQPANPQVVYVPQYDPAVVYAGPSTGSVVAGLITFGAGITIGAALANRYAWGWGGWGWNWGGRTLLYNRAAWRRSYIRYRSPRPIYRPRPPRYSGRPGFGGSWGRPGVRPGLRPNPGRPNPGNRPNPGTRPNPGNGSRPGNRPNPGARPNLTRPAPNRNPYAGFPSANRGPASRPAPGARPNVFSNGSGSADRAASARGRQSVGGGPRKR